MGESAGEYMFLSALTEEQENRRETFYGILSTVKSKEELPEVYWKDVRQALIKCGLLA